MPHSVTLQNAAVNATARDSGASYIGLHSGNPGTTGASEITGGSYARVQAVAPAAVNGGASFPAAIINVPAGNTVTYWARYTTASGGTPYDSGAMPGAGVVFDIAGTLTVNLTVTQAA